MVGYGMGGRYGHGYKREKGIAERRRPGGGSRRASVAEIRSKSEYRAPVLSCFLTYTNNVL